MKKEDIEEIIDNLLQEMEEEDIGISLFSTFYQNHNDLIFFNETDRQRVLQILTKLSEDCVQHKKILARIVDCLGCKCYEI